MYLKQLSLFLLALCPVAAFAQPSLTATNFNPNVTDAFAIRVCNPTPMLPGGAGPGQVWDMTGLTTTSNDSGKVNTCPSTASTAHCALFPSANIYMKGFGLAYQTIYYQTSPTGQSVYGYYSSPDTIITLTDPADQFRYPLTYGSHYSDPYAGLITIGPLSGHVNGTIDVEGDAYGTLKLPGRTDDNVLRVHTSQIFIDSVHVVASSTIVMVYRLETYSWYIPDYHAPLLTYAAIFPASDPTPLSQFVAYAPAKVNAVASITAVDELNIYPNPAQGELNIDYTTKSAQNVRISLLDITGREVAVMSDKTTAGAQHVSYNTASLTAGLYMARIQCGTETVTRKVEIQ